MRARLEREQRSLREQQDALRPAVERALGEAQHQLAQRVTALDALSPLRVLSRGYAIALRADGRALRDADDVQVGDTIEVRVARARVQAEVRGVAREAGSAPDATADTAPGSAPGSEGDPT
jgi:exodeoxyribonuclease VII large subunit